MSFKRFALAFFLSLLCLLQTSFTNAKTDSSEGNSAVYFKISIDKIGYESVQAIKNSPDVQWWIEADHEILVLAPLSTARKLNRIFDVETLPVTVKENLLFHFQNFHKNELATLPVDILIRAGRSAIVQARSDQPIKDVVTERFWFSPKHRILPFKKNFVLAKQVENEPSTSYVSFPDNVDNMVNAVNSERWFADVKKLTASKKKSPR